MSAARVLLVGCGALGTVIAEQLERTDDPTSSEALHALARIGTRQAASLLANQLQAGRAERRAAAEEALWQLPPARAAIEVQQLLGSRDFVVQHPDIAVSLLYMASQVEQMNGESGMADE